MEATPFCTLHGIDRANNVLSNIFGHSAGDALWGGTLDNFKQWIGNPYKTVYVAKWVLQRNGPHGILLNKY